MQGFLLCLPLNHILVQHFLVCTHRPCTFRLEAEKLVRHCDHQGVHKIQQLQGLCQLQGLEQLYHLLYSRIMGSLHRRGQTNRDRVPLHLESPAKGRWYNERDSQDRSGLISIAHE